MSQLIAPAAEHDRGEIPEPSAAPAMSEERSGEQPREPSHEAVETNGKAASPVPPLLGWAPGALADDMNIFGWTPREELSGDENGMDLVLLLARNSRCGGGHMGCAVATPDGKIVATGLNSPLFGNLNAKRAASDSHAEVIAIGSCARRGISTEGATAYITMPPCKKCLTVLAASGFRRVVSRKSVLEQDRKDIEGGARNSGIELIVVPDSEERRSVREGLVGKRSKPEQQEAAQE
eukprot:TRINITY_DN51985_c0_g1_i1.p2 TRINITY_DN51985_c0_g1~~TRINITY_DN51985_c0_g1_i1.p2  ORF type:complete len:236 (+),score=46.13 TRINITY_DN51985_c0_g1_i1:127-834(+)